MTVPLDRFDGRNEKESLTTFMDLCDDPETTQHQVLNNILDLAAGTEFGKQHGFDDIDGIEQFRDRVHVTEWDTYESFSDRLQHGEKDLLFPGQPTHFVCTSGSGGRIKALPESARGAKAKAAVSKARRVLLMKCLAGIENNCFLPLSNSATVGKTPCGLPMGTASGLSLMDTPKALLEQMAFPPEVLRVECAEAMDYLVMRFALMKNVTVIVGNNAGRTAGLFQLANERLRDLLDDIRSGAINTGLDIDKTVRDKLLTLTPDPAPERAARLEEMADARGSLIPGDYWPGLRVFSCWLAGTVGRYAESIRPQLPDQVTFVDCGYGASEIKMNIPLTVDSPSGALTIFAGFFEFLPSNGADPLLAHELSDGEQYRLLVTTYSGLYRYDMHDIVQVDGFTGKTPNIFFANKTSDIGNICGEKITAGNVATAFANATESRAMTLAHYCAVADADTRSYCLCVEADPADQLDSAFLRELEVRLRESCFTYDYFRKQQLLKHPRMAVMKPGWQKHLYAKKTRPGITSNQVKLPMVQTDMPAPDWIERIVRI